jgi:glyoxylase-like metal-dependent hydrolase (beta-lactamase superfamily II)
MTAVQRLAVTGAPNGIDFLRIGAARIYRIADIEGIAWPARALFGSLTDAALQRAATRLPAGSVDPGRAEISLSFNSFLIEMPGMIALVDAGIGNDKERLDRPAWHRRTGNFLEVLTALGFAPERIDIVVNTHLHADHVGWNTVRGPQGWRPTFPRARYLASHVELDHWQAQHAADPTGQTLHGAFADSILPILEAKRYETVTAPCEIAPGLRLEPAAGHSPGMMTVHLSTPDGDVAILADVLHHPLQLAEPELGSNFCADPAQARATRRRLLRDCAESGAIIAPYHFPRPAFGRLAQNGAGFDFAPLGEAGKIDATVPGARRKPAAAATGQG